jgi:hypothetical protein
MVLDTHTTTIAIDKMNSAVQLKLLFRQTRLSSSESEPFKVTQAHR